MTMSTHLSLTTAEQAQRDRAQRASDGPLSTKLRLLRRIRTSTSLAELVECPEDVGAALREHYARLRAELATYEPEQIRLGLAAHVILDLRATEECLELWEQAEQAIKAAASGIRAASVEMMRACLKVRHPDSTLPEVLARAVKGG